MIFLKTIFKVSALVIIALGPLNASMVEGDASTSKPLIRLTADARDQVSRGFDDFQKTQQTRRENIFAYRSLSTYADTLGIGQDFKMLQSWVINTDSPEIMLPLVTIAQLLSTKTATHITEATLQEYIADSQEASKRAFLLGLIAHNTSKLQNGSSEDATGMLHLNFHDLSTAIEFYDKCYITSQYPCDTTLWGGGAPTAGERQQSLAPKNMDTFYELLAIKLGYKKRAELQERVQALQEKNDEDLKRVILTNDFISFISGKKDSMATPAPLGIKFQMLDHARAPFLGNASLTSQELLPHDAKIEELLTAHILNSVLLLQNFEAARYAPHGDFLSCSQGDESILDKAPVTLDVHFDKGFILRGDDLLTLKPSPMSSGIFLESAGHTEMWALSLEGDLRINSRHESCLKVINHHHLFSGVDVACAGHISVKNGKITHINNSSGHYAPSYASLLFAIKYFDHLGLFSEDATARNVSGISGGSTLKEMVRSARMIEIIPAKDIYSNLSLH